MKSRPLAADQLTYRHRDMLRVPSLVVLAGWSRDREERAHTIRKAHPYRIADYLRPGCAE